MTSSEEDGARRIWGAFSSLLIVALVTLALLELSLRLIAVAGYFSTKPRVTDSIPFYQDRDPVFGVWHEPNAEFVATSPCFESTYRSNSWGMRDDERSLESSSPRVVVLGDSFVEGIGVDHGERMTDLLEARSSIEHLNFGTAGNFSSIQQWLLYDSLASRFDHDLVLLFMLPDNDFIENDLSRFWEPHRYRPYLVRADPSTDPQGDRWVLRYPVGFEEAQDRASRQLWWNKWYNRFFVYRFFSSMETHARARMAVRGESGRPYSGYSDFSDEDLDRLIFSYRQLLERASPRQVVIFTIPRAVDFDRNQDSAAVTWLPTILRGFSESTPRLHYVDLLPGFLEDKRESGRSISDYFHSCDGHWSTLGNEVAARIVLDAIGHMPPFSHAKTDGSSGGTEAGSGRAERK